MLSALEQKKCSKTKRPKNNGFSQAVVPLTKQLKQTSKNNPHKTTLVTKIVRVLFLFCQLLLDSSWCRICSITRVYENQSYRRPGF